MKYTVDFKECLKDSPKFRSSLEDAEADIESLEVRLERLVKQCTVMIDTGRSFSTASSGFLRGVRDLGSYFNDDPLVSGSLNRFAHSMSEMLKYFNILMDQANRSVCKNLSSFVKEDVKKVKETKKVFEKISDDMDSALNRNAQTQRSKPMECEEALNTLTATRACFAHTSLDYVFQINVLNSKKRFDILDTMLSFMHAQNTFFHQGHDLFQDLESTYMKEIAGQVEELSSKARVERKDMEDRHSLVQQKDLGHSLLLQGEVDLLHTEGYLYKRNSNAFKNYVRRWFSIQDSKLMYRKRSKDSQTVMEEDLRLCTIRPQGDLDRRFCFEVLSPTRSHILQADSDDECSMWISALNASISQAYKDILHREDPPPHHPHSPSQGPQFSLTDQASPQSRANKEKLWREQLIAVPGNSSCCDCGMPDPRWASINLGITLCIECSGIHRSFGVHMSKVRSVTLDSWEPEHVKVMLELGNEIINKIYEANVDDAVYVRATHDCNRTVREAWIRAKYVTRAFIRPLPGVNKTNKFRQWSVRKKTRSSRSPGRHLKKSKSDAPRMKESPSNLSGDSTGGDSGAGESAHSDSEDLTSGMLEGGDGGNSVARRAVLSVSTFGGSSSSSGISAVSPGDSATSNSDTSGNIVFGEDCPAPPVIPALAKSLDLSSDESSAEVEEEQEEDGREEDGEGAGSRGAVKSTGSDISGQLTPWEAMSRLDPNLLLYKATAARNLGVMLEAIGHGADPNWVCLEEEGRTPLMRAVLTGSLATCEFLLLNNAKLDRRDKSGRTPLHHATTAAHTGQVCQFLKRKADVNAKDNQGKTPLELALESENANADIVTLLRLAKLNEEMKDSDGYMGNAGIYRENDTFQDVCRDFTHLASNNPEKLKRK